MSVTRCEVMSNIVYNALKPHGSSTTRQLVHDRGYRTMDVMKMENITPRMGIEPTSPAFLGSHVISYKYIRRFA